MQKSQYIYFYFIDILTPLCHICIHVILYKLSQKAFHKPLVLQNLLLIQHWQGFLFYCMNHMIYILCVISLKTHICCTLLNLVQSFSSLLFFCPCVTLKIYSLDKLTFYIPPPSYFHNQHFSNYIN